MRLLYISQQFSENIRHRQYGDATTYVITTYLIVGAYTFGGLPLYYNYMRFAPPTAVELGTQDASQYQDLVSLEGYYRWPKVLSDLKRQWALVCTSCTLIVSLSISLPQIGGVMGCFMARTSVLAALIFGGHGSGLINSVFYISLRLNVDSVAFRSRWIEASRCLKRKKSLDF
ncbi:hypothetical protein CPB84DRAFT_1770548 [Gymnopilus junonius]|uniref:Uncharacterized protein n=1 Tax=Gymnopilus junonius TaxID=109634 RepID=A0A9P5NRD8_GYMJU|nr:hypothetical protein CPB84DRAFT_1770548 [Gymnopilus junonius]